MALSVSGYVALGAGPVVDSEDSVCPWVLFVLVFGDAVIGVPAGFGPLMRREFF